MDAKEQVYAYHRATKHPAPAGRPGLLPFHPLDPGNRPAPFKRYPGLPAVPLPPPGPPSGAPAGPVLGGGWHPERRPVDAPLLATLLFGSAGVVRVAGPAHDPIYFRAAMSAGNLHPVEVYLVCHDLPGIPDGVHHLDPLELGLTQLRRGRFGPASCALVLTGIPWRTCWKYGERGWRHLYWDAGTMLANLLALAQAHGVEASVENGFVDAQVADLVGADGTTEFPLVVVTLGEQELAEQGPWGWADPGPLGAEVTPIAPRPLTFPLVTAVQEAGVLADVPALTDWRSRAGRPTHPAAVPGPPDTPTVEETIRRRGSTRWMAPTEAPERLLSWGLAAADRPVAADTAWVIDHQLAVHAVTGLPSGTYRWSGGRPDLLQARSDIRSLAQHLCLDQPLGGGGAFTAFHGAELEDVLGRLGARGYRVAHLQAGLAAGRLALAAFALGYGATGLTFYDDEVAAAFATPSSCLLVTAVGTPAYRSKAGGPPGRPTHLSGFGRLTSRSFSRRR